MNLNLLKACVPLGGLLLFSACVDNNYDLSGFDKTTEIKVNDLVLPINIDEVKLGDIITIDDDSKIKIVTIDGKEIYAVTEHGDITSDPIEIEGFTATAPHIDPATAVFNIESTLTASNVKKTKAVTQTSIYNLYHFTPQDVNINAVDVDESIRDIYSIACNPMEIKVIFNAVGLGSNTTLKFQKLELNFLKGLVIEDMPSNYAYNSETGKLTITDIDCPNHQTVLTLHATGVDFTKTGTKLENHSFHYASTIELEEATMEMTTTFDGIPDFPSQVNFSVNTTVSDLVAREFSGEIEYNLEGEGLDIDPVDLSDIPDFLNGDDTNLRLANPQIYLSLNNPVANYGIHFQTGLQLVAVRPDAKSEYNLDPGKIIMVDNRYGVAGPYNFVLSPTMPTDPLAAYARNLEHVGFAGLGDVLSGKGLPNSIEINLIKPELPTQKVYGFQLFNTIPGVVGSYEFFAPLALKTGDNPAVIVYRDTKDGWSDDELDKITINTLGIEADVDSQLPLGAELRIYPLDKMGNRIPGVEVSSATIEANKAGQHITVVTKGEIRNLDGVNFEAVVRPGSSETLSPEQTIRLFNIKAKISGSYTTDFE